MVAALGCAVVFTGLTLLQIMSSSTPTIYTASSSEKTYDFLGTDILFIVMGEHQYFQRWYNRLRDDDDDNDGDSSKNNKKNSNKNNHAYDDRRSGAARNAISTTLMYGSYDVPVSANTTNISCSFYSHHASKGGGVTSSSFPPRPRQGLAHCQTHYIPKTTWTQGRNQLAKEAILLEHKRGKKFDFWAFSDEDVALSCGQHNSTLDDARTCWQTFLRFLGGQPEELPPKATTVSLQKQTSTNKYKDSWIGVSTTDAMINAFRRDFVPFVLPYATLQRGDSEWLSQGVVFCIMMTCAPSSVLFVPNMNIYNPMHRAYIRKTVRAPQITLAVRENYDLRYQNMNISQHCETYKYTQEQELIGPFSSARDFNAHVPTPKTTANDYCGPLANRFSDFEASSILSMGSTGSGASP